MGQYAKLRGSYVEEKLPYENLEAGEIGIVVEGEYEGAIVVGQSDLHPKEVICLSGKVDDKDHEHGHLCYWEDDVKAVRRLRPDEVVEIRGSAPDDDDDDK